MVYVLTKHPSNIILPMTSPMKRRRSIKASKAASSGKRNCHDPSIFKHPVHLTPQKSEKKFEYKAPHDNVVQSIKKASHSKASRILESPVFRRIRKSQIKTPSKLNFSAISSLENEFTKHADVAEIIANDNAEIFSDELKNKTKNNAKRNSIGDWLKRRSSLGTSGKPQLKDSSKRRMSLNTNNFINKNNVTNKNNFINEKIIEIFNKRSCNSTTTVTTTTATPKNPLIKLEDVLADSELTTLFHNFLKKEYSEENLLFWLECEKYKILPDDEIEDYAGKIFDTFIKVNAPRQVNIDSPTRLFIKADLLTPSHDMFSEAQQQIFRLMKRDSFARFISVIKTDS